jgi:hypothetical protein
LGTALRDGAGLGEVLGEVLGDGEEEAVDAPADTETPGDARRYGFEAFFVPVIALSDNMNTPNTSPARRVRRGPGRFIRASPEASLLP